MRNLFREMNTHIILNHLQVMCSTLYEAFQRIPKSSKATPNPSQLIILIKCYLCMLGKFLIRFHFNSQIIFTAINQKISSSSWKQVGGVLFHRYPWETLGLTSGHPITIEINLGVWVWSHPCNFPGINNRGLVADTTFGCQVSSFFASWHLISPGSSTSHPAFRCVSALKLMTQSHSAEHQLYLNKTGSKN